jgi:hypothetical protein
MGIDLFAASDAGSTVLPRVNVDAPGSCPHVSIAAELGKQESVEQCGTTNPGSARLRDRWRLFEHL